MNKKILDVTCGSRTIWFDKQYPAAVYCDKRDEEYTGIWKSTVRESERKCIVHPDVIADFRALPFADCSFSLVVFDPPHLKNIGETSWIFKKYGKLTENWPQMIHDGFEECMRVLKPDGVLIFKWSETEIPAADVVPVVHGRWRTSVLNGYVYTFVCSECGYADVYPFDSRHRYCPNCGAKMDGADAHGLSIAEAAERNSEVTA